MTAADYSQPFRIHYRGSILLCLKSTTEQCIIRKWSHGPAIVPKLLCYPRFFRSSFFIPRRALSSPFGSSSPNGERRNAGGSVGISLPVPRRLSQTYKSNPANKSLRRSHGGSRRSSYSPSYSSFAFAPPAPVPLHDSYRHPPTCAFLPSSCTLVGIMRRSRKETEVSLDFLNPKLVWSMARETLLFHRDDASKNCHHYSRLYDVLHLIFPFIGRITFRPRPPTSRYSLLNLFRQLPVFFHQEAVFFARSFSREIQSP